MSSLVITLFGLADGFAASAAVEGVCSAPPPVSLSAAALLSSRCCPGAAAMAIDPRKNNEPPAAQHRTTAKYATLDTVYPKVSVLPLFDDEHFAFLHHNRPLVEPQSALRIGFLHQPRAAAARLFAEGKIVLGQQVANLLLLRSHRDGITNGCCVRLQPASHILIVVVAAGVRGRAIIADLVTLQLDSAGRICRRVLAVFANALLENIGPVWLWHSRDNLCCLAPFFTP
jgi:hypothetical protein